MRSATTSCAIWPTRSRRLTQRQRRTRSPSVIRALCYLTFPLPATPIPVPAPPLLSHAGRQPQ
eukprot:10637076-Lingulodinium_polyedra.AAC.1